MGVLKMTHRNLFSLAAAAHFDYLNNYTDLAGGTEHTLCQFSRTGRNDISSSFIKCMCYNSSLVTRMQSCLSIY